MPIGRRVTASAVALLLTASLTPVAQAVIVEDRPPRPDLCGEDDRPETGLQGDVPKADQESGRAELGYSCGLARVGHTTLGAGGRPPGGNANMAWAGDCAYVSGPGAVFGRTANPDPNVGVAIVDVSDPTAPQHVGTLRTPGAQTTMETLHAVENGERAVLVVGEYGNQSGGDKPMSIFDVSDCTNPRLLEVFRWPENIHNLTISGNGRYVFATQPLQAVDIEPLFDADPATTSRYIGNIEAAVTDSALVAVGPGADLDDAAPLPKGPARYLSHEAWPSHDGTRLYLGGQLPTFETFTILDIGGWLDDPAQHKPEVVSQRSGRGHSVRTATIDGTQYALHSEESVFGAAKGCLPEQLNPFAGPAEPWLSDISNPEAPVMRVSQIGLEINRPENCGAQLDSGVDASVHYHDVDDPDDTSFVMLSMWNAGLRVVDVRDPARPVEVAYFNPGDVQPGPKVTLDKAWGHVRYVPETGHIWFVTQHGGFWVVELEPQVRAHLGLDNDSPPPPLEHPTGQAPWDGLVPPGAAPTLPVEESSVYCTLSLAA